jgi:hypothetical protein
VTWTLRHVAAIPDRLEDRVGKPEDEQVLDGLLAQEVVNPKDRVLREVLVKQRVERAGRREVTSEGLLQDDPAAAVQPHPGKPLDDRGELVGRDRQVEQRMPGPPKLFRESIEEARLPVLTADVRQGSGELVEVRLMELVACLAYCGPGPLDEVVLPQGRASDADDGPVETATHHQPIDRWKQLLAGQIARCAEEHERIRAALRGCGRCARQGRPRFIDHRAPALATTMCSPDCVRCTQDRVVGSEPY